MKGNSDKFFADQRGDVPKEVLMRYINGTAAAEEVRWVEEKMVNDPFLSDAVEGLFKLNNPQHAIDDLDEIQVAIRKKARSRSRILILRSSWLKVAAAVCLLAGAVWFVNNRLQPSTEKIFTHEFEPYPAPQLNDAVTADKPAGIEYRPLSDTTGYKQTTKADKAILPPSEKVEDKVKMMTESHTEAAPEVYSDQSNTIEPAMAQQEDLAVMDAVTAEKDNVNAGQVSGKSEEVRQSNGIAAPPSASAAVRAEAKYNKKNQAETDEMVTLQKTALYDAKLDEALKLYHDGKYAEAINSFEEVLKIDDANDEANFYAAVSYLAINNADEALSKLKKLENKKSSTYYEAALWYEALAYVQKGEKKEAGNILDKVIRLDGEYRIKAEELLRKL